ncbi:MAG TPA: hypothetical protein VGM96_24655 [Reyranella sp.]|jgi:hypothetical protein
MGANICPHFDRNHAGFQEVPEHVGLGLGIFAVQVEHGAEVHVVRVVEHEAVPATAQLQMAIAEAGR